MRLSVAGNTGLLVSCDMERSVRPRGKEAESSLHRGQTALLAVEEEQMLRFQDLLEQRRTLAVHDRSFSWGGPCDLSSGLRKGFPRCP